MAESSREVAATIAGLIHRKRPDAAFLTYIKDHTDGIMSESNTAVGRALPMWPYSASDNVRRSLGSEPDKVAINLAMSFIDFPWRYAHVPQPETALRLYQNLAHGAPPAAVVSGPLPQADRSGLLAAKPVFDIDSVGLLKLLSDMNDGLGVRVGGNGQVRSLRGTQFYLGAGAFEGSLAGDGVLEQNRLQRDVLRGLGYSVAYQEFVGGHDHLAWRATLPDGLIALYAPTPE